MAHGTKIAPKIKKKAGTEAETGIEPKKIIEADAPIVIPELEEKAIEEDAPAAAVEGEEEEESEDTATLDDEDLNPFGDKWEQ
jgi:hypothetical protein